MRLPLADSKLHIHWKGVSGDSLGLVYRIFCRIKIGIKTKRNHPVRRFLQSSYELNHVPSSNLSSLNLYKHRFILWQVANSQLLTRDKMVQFHVELESLAYPVCGNASESHKHFYFDCTLKAWPLDIIGWRS
ncbi:hypothetical protein G4B88_009672 [Cannabis sativa]|uniref:Reverse transcriptase zinc-binding domain-containing protein n=1 Tax=Cannabis sativa TaxID=3483 RepID=A0A7J6FHB9_CANSA|nr:hypothetical protein G4B88_009672 [Cannabis sativa]